MSYFGDGYAKLSFPIAYPDAEIAGFREAQRGALFAIGAHFTARTDSAIVTMPTGSGKTAVLQATAFLLRAKRTLVISPSRLVREQIAADFATLGVLKPVRLEECEQPRPLAAVDCTGREPARADVFTGAPMPVGEAVDAIKKQPRAFQAHRRSGAGDPQGCQVS